MSLKNLLTKKKTAILDKWLNLILDTYPGDGAEAFKRNADRFTNPVGYTISKEIDTLYEELVHDMDCNKLHASIDNIVRIRAVQDYSPSQATAFIFLLKKAIRNEVTTELREDQLFNEYMEFESRIDELALFTFDIHMMCREKIYELKVNEIKNEKGMLVKLLERSNGTNKLTNLP